MSKKPSKETITAWAKLIKAQRVLLEKVEADLSNRELPPLSWYDVLIEIHQAPDRRIRSYEIGNRTLLNKYNVSRLLDRLEGEKLIRSEACAADRRGREVILTKEGVALLKKMWPVYAASINSCFASRLSGDEIRSLSMMMGKLLD